MLIKLYLFVTFFLIMAPKTTTKKSSTNSKEPTTKVKQPIVKELIIRPLNKEYLKNFRNYPNILITQSTCEILELTKGSFVKLSIGLKELVFLIDIIDDNGDDNDNIDDDIVLVNQYYLDLYGISLGERAIINKFNGKLEYADSINVDYIGDITENDIVDIGIVYNGLNCEKFYINGINEINEKMKELSIEEKEDDEVDEEEKALIGYLIHPKNTVIKLDKVESLPEIFKKYSFNDIGGHSQTIKQIKKTILIPLEKGKLFKSFGIEPPRGILLYGNSGVGKTMIMKSISSEFRKCHIIKIDGSSIISKYLGDSEEKIRKSFKEAIKYQPSIILIDEIDSILPNRLKKDDISDIDNRIINTFNSMIDELHGNGKIVIIGATNQINNIDISLRRPGRFDIEIEIKIPDIEGRFDILQKQINKIDKDQLIVSNDEIYEISTKTHGYVGSDLLSLVRESIMNSIDRYITQGESKMGLKKEDFEIAMKEIRPSAMKEIMLEMPEVKWSDIGGQEELKVKLHEMVELPLKEIDRFKKFGIKAPKGLLLYGPPGCSKTMTAKALATESGLNFFAIKGPEIFDKYVGESERKIRDIFQKARISSPSIIFIDEIDAIAVDREGGESTNVSKQVLNTMLNELDGVEELNGVILIGATNRPLSIDPALLRPGRLDRHVYVGPPDELARKEIFIKNTIKFGISDIELSEIIDYLVANTDGCSGSECVLLCQEAGLSAVSKGKESVTRDDFDKALDELVRNIDQEMIEYYESFANKSKSK